MFAANYPFWFHLILISASLLIMLKAADLLVYGITDYAHKLGFSDYLIGLIIVSFGASIPELVSSAMGIAAGESTIIFGTILGSNIAGLALVLGVISFVGKKVKTNKKVLKKTGPIMFGLALIPIIMMFNGILSRTEGIILIAVFIGYNYYIYKKEGEIGKIKKNVKIKRIYRDMIVAIGTLLVIILAGRWLVFSSIEIAHMFSISPFILAITIIAIGTQIPDLAIGLRSLIRGHQDVAFADILGSTITKLLLFFGLFAIISPLKMDPKMLVYSMLFMVISLGMVLMFARKGIMTRKHGIILIATFIIFILLNLFL